MSEDGSVVYLPQEDGCSLKGRTCGIFPPNAFSLLKPSGQQQLLRGPRRVVRLCVFALLLPAVLITVPLYVRLVLYPPAHYPMMPTDQRLLARHASSFWCQAQWTHMNGTYNAYVSSKTPPASLTRSIHHMLHSTTLQDDIKEYWGFHLLKGSTVTISTCASTDGAQMMILRGVNNLHRCAWIGEKDSAEEKEEAEGQTINPEKGAGSPSPLSKETEGGEEPLQPKEAEEDLKSDVAQLVLTMPKVRQKRSWPAPTTRSESGDSSACCTVVDKAVIPETTTSRAMNKANSASPRPTPRTTTNSARAPELGSSTQPLTVAEDSATPSTSAAGPPPPLPADDIAVPSPPAEEQDLQSSDAVTAMDDGDNNTWQYPSRKRTARPQNQTLINGPLSPSANHPSDGSPLPPHQYPVYRIRPQDRYPCPPDAVLALEHLNSALRVKVRMGRDGSALLTPLNDDSHHWLDTLTTDPDAPCTIEQLSPDSRLFRAVLIGFPLSYPTKILLRHSQVVDATRCLTARTREPTRQVLLKLRGSFLETLDLGNWGLYRLRPYTSEPLRCYKCQKYGHHQAVCEELEKCGICSGQHATRECLDKYKAKQPINSCCPNCSQRHHVWFPLCPARQKRVLQGREQQTRWVVTHHGSSDSQRSPESGVSRRSVPEVSRLPPPPDMKNTATFPTLPKRSPPPNYWAQDTLRSRRVLTPAPVRFTAPPSPPPPTPGISAAVQTSPVNLRHSITTTIQAIGTQTSETPDSPHFSSQDLLNFASHLLDSLWAKLEPFLSPSFSAEDFHDAADQAITNASDILAQAFTDMS